MERSPSYRRTHRAMGRGRLHSSAHSPITTMPVASQWPPIAAWQALYRPKPPERPPCTRRAPLAQFARHNPKTSRRWESGHFDGGHASHGSSVFSPGSSGGKCWRECTSLTNRPKSGRSSFPPDGRRAQLPEGPRLNVPFHQQRLQFAVDHNMTAAGNVGRAKLSHARRMRWGPSPRRQGEMCRGTSYLSIRSTGGRPPGLISGVGAPSATWART